MLTGEDERAFCVGGDLEWEAGGGLQATHYDLGRKIVDHPKPIIASVFGYAIGVGYHMAYFCDLTIAADNAIFGQNGTRVAAPNAGYTSAQLVSIIGHKRVREMEMPCRKYSAAQALAWGLVNEVVPRAELDATLRRWCDELLGMSPGALAALKVSFRVPMAPYIDLSMQDAVAQARPDFFTSGELQEGVAAFFEKRPPDYSRFR